jgi:hypothetical protein
MNCAQYNYVRASTRLLAIVAVILAANPASGAPSNPTGPHGATMEKGRIAYPATSDPLLDGGDTSSCMARADLADGVDATGQSVVPADVGAPPTPVPDEIMVPLDGGSAQRSFRGRGPNPVTGTGAYAGFDGRRMAPLLTPRPCR